MAPPPANPPLDRDGGDPREERRYRPRCVEPNLLREVVRRELETFLARAAARERTVPRFVARELQAFLRCGVLAHGFVRVHCDACGLDRAVPFSCKGRGFCPSCGGRRMAETAAHLVERVFPEVPVRQWVLSLPFALRYRLAYDASLTSAVLALFVRTVFASLRRRARVRLGTLRAQGGAVTFVQRFGDALNLNVHFHSLVIDGVYTRNPEGALRFRPLPPPDDAEVARVARVVARRVARLLERRGLVDSAGPRDQDALAQDEPLLAEIAAASVAGRVATGRRAGARVVRIGDRIDAEDLPRLVGERCASVGGVSVHANVAVPARDRRRLERLCRYVARPALAAERLSRRADGRLLYRLKHRWRDGTTHLLFEPAELVEKLAALVPPPRVHGARYHGVFAPCARARPRVVPGSVVRGVASERTHAHGTGDAPRAIPAHDTATPAPREHGARAEAPPDGEAEGARGLAHATAHSSSGNLLDDATPVATHAKRTPWAELLRRVFAIDVLACPRCGARTRVISAHLPPEAAEAILGCLGLPARAPPPAPARHDELEPEDANDG